MQVPDPVRAMYEALPFPSRRLDHVEYAEFLVASLERHAAPMTGTWLDLGCGTGELLAAFAVHANPEVMP